LVLGTFTNHVAVSKFSTSRYTVDNTVYIKFNISEFTKDKNGNIEVYSLKYYTVKYLQISLHFMELSIIQTPL